MGELLRLEGCELQGSDDDESVFGEDGVDIVESSDEEDPEPRPTSTQADAFLAELEDAPLEEDPAKEESEVNDSPHE